RRRRRLGEQGPSRGPGPGFPVGRACPRQHRRHRAPGKHGCSRNRVITMSKNSIGLIELTSIAAGYQVTDAMLKASDVDMILSRSICSGKYMVMVRGDVAAVEAAVSSGISGCRFAVIDSFVIPNLHEAVFPAIAGTTKVEEMDALGIVESFSVASLI